MHLFRFQYMTGILRLQVQPKPDHKLACQLVIKWTDPLIDGRYAKECNQLTGTIFFLNCNFKKS